VNFLGVDLNTEEKSLHPQTGWRWTESGGNWSLAVGGVQGELVSAD
jgi:hypothetical protein